MTGAGAVAALVFLQWSAGTLALAAWSQSWKVVRRGHFRIVAWSALGLVGVALLAVASATPDLGETRLHALLLAGAAVAAISYRVAQGVEKETVPVAAGVIAAVVGAAALAAKVVTLEGWSPWLAVAQVAGGALLLGAVTNGMLLGHWYLNQPGLQPWALARLSGFGLAAVAAAGVLGLVAGPRLAGASTEGAVLGLPGFGEAFGTFFYVTWIALLAFTGGVVWAALRCVRIRSIQSATGLFYVAVLTAGVSEFLVRYLMVNAG